MPKVYVISEIPQTIGHKLSRVESARKMFEHSTVSVPRDTAKFGMGDLASQVYC